MRRDNTSLLLTLRSSYIHHRWTVCDHHAASDMHVVITIIYCIYDRHSSIGHACFDILEAKFDIRSREINGNLA